MNSISTNILDTHRGCPASDVPIELRVLKAGVFEVIADGRTNSDGRLPGLLAGKDLPPGVYQMFFGTQEYHQGLGIKGFYPYVEVTFEIVNTDQHYHVPLLISPFGFSTYRGS